MRDECQHGQLRRQCQICELIIMVRTLYGYIISYGVPILEDDAHAVESVLDEHTREAGKSPQEDKG